MSDFAHVESGFIRSVLIGETIDAKAIIGAAYATEFFMAEDWKSALIPIEVMEARESACDAMTDCINDSDFPGAVDAMRRFWSL